MIVPRYKVVPAVLMFSIFFGKTSSFLNCNCGLFTVSYQYICVSTNWEYFKNYDVCKNPEVKSCQKWLNDKEDSVCIGPAMSDWVNESDFWNNPTYSKTQTTKICRRFIYPTEIITFYSLIHTLWPIWILMIKYLEYSPLCQLWCDLCRLSYLWKQFMTISMHV